MRRWNRLRATVVCAGTTALLWLATPAWAQTMRVHFLDVGQGSAAIVESECAAVLIDTGGELNGDFDSPQALIDQLEDFFFGRPHLKRTFALMVLSHPHLDHTRSVAAVLEKYTVLNAVTNGQELGSGKGGQKTLHRLVALSEQGAGEPVGFEPIVVDELPARGLVNEVVNPIACGTVNPKITALWGTANTEGWTKKDAGNQNNHSVVLRIDFGRSSLLFTGDLEERGIAGLVERYKQKGVLDVDLYVVGHHGAANATTLALLEQVTPKIAVISMGSPSRMTTWTAWAYGHPRKPIVQLLASKVSEGRAAATVDVASGVRSFERLAMRKAVYATGWDGALVFEADLDGRWSLVSDQPDAPPVATPRHPVAQPAGPRKVNVNTATADELDTLPMIGLKRARAIVKHRQAHGPFSQAADLLQVEGIGQGTVKAIRRLIRFE